VSRNNTNNKEEGMKKIKILTSGEFIHQGQSDENKQHGQNEERSPELGQPDINPSGIFHYDNIIIPALNFYLRLIVFAGSL
jgi:hypothetical protein